MGRGTLAPDFWVGHLRQRTTGEEYHHDMGLAGYGQLFSTRPPPDGCAEDTIGICTRQHQTSSNGLQIHSANHLELPPSIDRRARNVCGDSRCFGRCLQFSAIGD